MPLIIALGVETDASLRLAELHLSTRIARAYIERPNPKITKQIGVIGEYTVCETQIFMGMHTCRHVYPNAGVCTQAHTQTKSP